MKVLLRAPLLSVSGYGVHSRQIFEWLEGMPDIELSVELLKWGLTSWMIDPELEDGMIGRIMSRSGNIKKGSYDISIQVQLPDEWDPALGKKNIGVTALVETDRCSQKWIDSCNAMDKVIVPSAFTKNILKRSGLLTTPITVVPEWFNSFITNDNKKSDIKISINPKFNFLMIGTITSKNANDDRKNLFYSLKWFCEEFKDDKKVGLVLKTCYGKGTKIDKNLTKDTLEKVLKEVRPGKFPKITLIHGNMKKREIADLYKKEKIKAYVSATKGEGYGLPIIEAAASGMPVIATNWSGHLEFLEEGKFLGIDYRLEEINESRIDGRIFIKGSRWAKVDENDFKSKLRDMKENYSKHKKNALEMQNNIHKNFSKEKIKEIYSYILKELTNV